MSISGSCSWGGAAHPLGDEFGELDKSGGVRESLADYLAQPWIGAWLEVGLEMDLTQAR